MTNPSPFKIDADGPLSEADLSYLIRQARVLGNHVTRFVTSKSVAVSYWLTTLPALPALPWSPEQFPAPPTLSFMGPFGVVEVDVQEWVAPGYVVAVDEHGVTLGFIRGIPLSSDEVQR